MTHRAANFFPKDSPHAHKKRDFKHEEEKDRRTLPKCFKKKKKPRRLIIFINIRYIRVGGTYNNKKNRISRRASSLLLLIIIFLLFAIVHEMMRFIWICIPRNGTQQNSIRQWFNDIVFLVVIICRSTGVCWWPASYTFLYEYCFETTMRRRHWDYNIG